MLVDDPPVQRRRAQWLLGRRGRWTEWGAEAWIRACGLMVPGMLLAVMAYVAVEALVPRGQGPPLHGFLSSLLGWEWRPLATPPRFGVLTLVAGTAVVTGLGLAVALPLGVGVALWLVGPAPPRLAGAVATLTQFLAAVPSVIIGLLGREVIGPGVAALGGSRYPQSALAAGLALGFMVLPTVVLLAVEALRGVPSALTAAARALGATRWEALTQVVLPAAAPGLVAAGFLALARGVGETMVMLMAAGSIPQLPRSLLDPVEPVTAVVAWEMGEALAGGSHYRALFCLALLLLVGSLGLSAAAAWIRRGVSRPR